MARLKKKQTSALQANLGRRTNTEKEKKMWGYSLQNGCRVGSLMFLHPVRGIYPA